jgi:hypothetical protein
MFGDLALIQKSPDLEPQKEKGFYDKDLISLIETGNGNRNLSKPITVSSKEGGNTVTFNNLKDLAEEYFQVLGLAH